MILTIACKIVDRIICSIFFFIIVFKVYFRRRTNLFLVYTWHSYQWLDKTSYFKSSFLSLMPIYFIVWFDMFETPVIHFIMLYILNPSFCPEVVIKVEIIFFFFHLLSNQLKNCHGAVKADYSFTLHWLNCLYWLLSAVVVPVLPPLQAKCLLLMRVAQRRRNSLNQKRTKVDWI